MLYYNDLEHPPGSIDYQFYITSRLVELANKTFPQINQLKGMFTAVPLLVCCILLMMTIKHRLEPGVLH